MKGDSNYVNQEWKGETSLLNLQAPHKVYQGILWSAVCQQITWPRWNGLLERHKLMKLTQEGIENINKLITNKENELVIKSLLQRKTPAQMASLVSCIKCLERSNINPSQMIAKIKSKSRANTSQLILWYHWYPNSNTRQRYRKERNYTLKYLKTTDTKILKQKNKLAS